jgi:AraC family transcriptional regulator
MPSQDTCWAKENATLQFDHFLFREVSYASQHGSPSHAHGQTHLIYFLNGAVKDVRQQRTAIRTPGMLILIPPDEIHSAFFLEDVRTFEIVLSSTRTDARQATALTERPLDYRNGSPIEIARRLHREFQTRDNLAPLMLEGLMLELLAQMARDSLPRTDSRCPHWLVQTKEFLHAHFAERVSLETIAAEAGVHPSHLIRAFGQHFHCTIGNYVRELRIQQARHVLSTSETPLSEIALAVGYSDQSHFTTAFKRQTGISPGEYRKTYRKR